MTFHIAFTWPCYRGNGSDTFLIDILKVVMTILGLAISGLVGADTAVTFKVLLWNFFMHSHKWRQDCCKTCKWKWKVLLVKFASDTTISKQVSCLKKPQIPNLCPSPIVVHSRLSSFNLEYKQFNLTHKWNVNYVALKPQHAILTHWSSKSIKIKAHPSESEYKNVNWVGVAIRRTQRG